MEADNPRSGPIARSRALFLIPFGPPRGLDWACRCQGESVYPASRKEEEEEELFVFIGYRDCRGTQARAPADESEGC